MSQLPIARKEGLVLQELPDELLVYDLETNKAHCLNQTSATVWKACDGKNTVNEISRLLGNSVPQDLVWLAIDQLSEKNLLKNPVSLDSKGQNRREVIKKIALAALITLPLVQSISAKPTGIAVTCAASAQGTCGGCASGQSCCGGVCTTPQTCGGTACP